MSRCALQFGIDRFSDRRAGHLDRPSIPIMSRNTTRGIGMHSEETKRKIRLAHNDKSAWSRGKHLSISHRRKISEATKGVKKKPYVRKPCSEGKKRKISKALMGRKLSKNTINKMKKTRKGFRCSEETKRKISKALTGRKSPWSKPPPPLRGEQSPHWKGGVCPENKKIRSSIELKLWREAVFARDDWTCQKCKKRGVTLHSHHIKSFAKYPKLRTSVKNGTTLCYRCHIKSRLHRKVG